MVDRLALLVVLLAGFYLIGLGVLALVSPDRTRDFLSRFAESRAAHFLELTLRLAVGAAMVLHAPHMKLGDLFTVSGWIVIGTTVVLLALPWTWHRRFARWSVPRATRHVTLLGLGSLAGGALVLLSVVLGPEA